MKATDLKVGEHYRIEWLKAVPAKTVYGINGGGPSTTVGVGKLKQKGYPRSGWHQFTLKGTRQHVYAASRSIEPIGSEKSMFYAEPKVILKDEISEDVARLRLLGADDDTRREEVESIATFLSGLGVESNPDKEFTHLVIPYLGLANFKAVVARLYRRALLSEDER